MNEFMNALGYDEISFWIVATAVLVNVSCAVLGCFLVLRRMSLLGDAISHAILPGLALGFILSGSRSVVPMLAGALVAGVVTALLTQAIHRYARVSEDAAMGVVFTSLFALGVLMIHRVAKQVDLDPGCVLYGILESVAFEMGPGDVMPRPTFNMLVMCLLTIAFVVVLWKELKIVSFDPGLADSQGYNTHVIHYLLMTMVAAVTVTAFEAVGSILVVAMLIVPAATAYLLTDKLSLMVIIASIAGIASAVLGRDFASHLQTSVPGMMAVVAGGLFTIAVMLAPRHGYLIKIARQWGLSLRITQEDILALLYRLHEAKPDVALERRQALEALGGGLAPRLAMRMLHWDGRVRIAATPTGSTGLQLTNVGRQQAQTLVKSHRLWETYLIKLGLPADHVHAPADRTEHFLSEQVLREVAVETENPATDPHGKPIPRREESRTDLPKTE